MKGLGLKWELVREFTLLDLKARYRGSSLGALWSLLHPLMLLGIYTLVFQVILQPHWHFGPEGDPYPYVLSLFCGIIVFNVLGESLLRSPTLIRTHANYMKQAAFPVEILPVVVVGSALVQFLVSLGVLLIGMLAFGKVPTAHLLLLPAVLVPLLLLSLGLAWLVTSLGAFSSDVAQSMPFLAQLLFFLTPILYPATAVPDSLRGLFLLNPLAEPVEAARSVLLFGQPLDWTAWALTFAAAAAVCAAGYAFFMRCRPAFVDEI